LRRLGSEYVTSLLVEGGGEVNASFLLQRLAHRVAFFYAPKILGGRDSIRAVAGKGIMRPDHAIRLTSAEHRTLGPDLLLSARVDASHESGRGQPHSKTSRDD
jgi:diaminohydroxyphosphoribosylaminopyrimidine deaminase/5-amino-6-(5-phosphoribosylamino)uracil reductase